MTAVRPAIPPGRSGTTTENRHRRPSFTSPRSSVFPSVFVSMFPPHNRTTTVFPSSSGSFPARHAAIPAAPAPSCTSFSHSTSLNNPTEMSLSLTVTSLSTRGRHTSNDRGPTVGTARPSASVGPGMSNLTTLPAANAAAIEGHRSGSTPMTMTFGLIVFTASATPAMSPPPPTGTNTISSFGSCRTISNPTVPCPATTSGSSNGGTKVRPSSSARFFAYACVAS
mmetsp:Transcript_6188/g.22649  ORF Transcript_6188/g.22649 Transcript_6188/m.22649 type:complete len:225 (-) Transcript_6188:885-1559(-)